MTKQTASLVHQQKQSVTPQVSGVLQRQCACGNHTVAGNECEECSKKGLTLQRASLSPHDREKEGQEAPPIVHEVLRSSGQPLDSATRSFFEPRFGYDFSQVRVHTDSDAAKAAQSISAHAFTMGRDIVFGANQYMPSTEAGGQLLAHELTHVVQQGSSSNSILRTRLKVGRSAEPTAMGTHNDRTESNSAGATLGYGDDSLEKEAAMVASQLISDNRIGWNSAHKKIGTIIIQKKIEAAPAIQRSMDQTASSKQKDINSNRSNEEKEKIYYEEKADILHRYILENKPDNIIDIIISHPKKGEYIDNIYKNKYKSVLKKDIIGILLLKYSKNDNLLIKDNYIQECVEFFYGKKIIDFEHDESLLKLKNISKEKSDIRDFYKKEIEKLNKEIVDLNEELKKDKLKKDEENKKKSNKNISNTKQGQEGASPEPNESFIKDEKAITILTSGTNEVDDTFKDKYTEENLLILSKKYFVAKNGAFDSYEAARDLSEVLTGNKDNGYFIEWNGRNRDADRRHAAFRVYDFVRQKLSETRQENLPLKINLVGHSHGGNVMILAANGIRDRLPTTNVKIVNLITLEAPVREYQLDKVFYKDIDEQTMKFTQTYAYGDIVQNIGYNDIGAQTVKTVLAMIFTFPIGLLAALRIGPDPHLFEKAKNIQIDKYHSIKTKKMHKELYKHFYELFIEAGKVLGSDPAIEYHQTTRWISFISEVLNTGN